MAITLRANSTEYIRFLVEAEESGVVVNPTTEDVEFAFIDSSTATPAALDWDDGEWETANSRSFARYLYGPTTVGKFWIWIRITTADETVIRQPGIVVVHP